MKKRNIVAIVACAIAVTISPSRRADAFWKGVGEWSGPGPWWGVDAILPIHLQKPPKLTADMMEDQRELLNLQFFRRKSERLIRREAAPDLLKNDESMQILGEKYDIEPLKTWRAQGKSDEELAQAYLEALDEASIRSPGSNEFLDLFRTTFGGVGTLRDLALASRVVPLHLDDAERQAAEAFPIKYRFYGLSKFAGLYGSQRTIDVTERQANGEVKNVAANRFITISFGYAQSWNNGIEYENYGGSRTVRWVTLYPAFEWRFKRNNAPFNFFVNAGPAIHQFWGDAFAAFNQYSTRGRVGVNIGRFQIGGEVDVFAPSVEHTRFGSVDPDDHRVGWGIYVGLELPALEL